MKKVNIIYWVSTGLFAALIMTSAIPNMLSSEEWVTIMTQLGYPIYILPLLGVAKLLGIIAIVVPGSHDLKNGHMQVLPSTSSELFIRELPKTVLTQ